MEFTRRQFMTLMGGSAATAVVFQACGVPPDEIKVQSSIQMPEDLVTGTDNWYATLDRLNPTSNGIVVRVMEGRAKKIEGNVDYPINLGKHKVVAEAGLQSLYDPDRISAPLVRVGDRGSGQWEEISWTDALSRLAQRIQGLQSTSGMAMVTDPVGSHLGMVVERFLTKIGARHLVFEPLDRVTLSAAMETAFNHNNQLYSQGRFVMPDFDIENAEYLLSFGADFLSTWVSPVRFARSYGRFRDSDNNRGVFVHADSRFSVTGANSDKWLYVNPGREGLLAQSIAQVIISEGLGDPESVRSLTADGSIDMSHLDPELVSSEIGVEAGKIRQIARDFASHRPSLAIGGGSAGAHTNGLSNLTAIYLLNYLVGSVGKKGGVILNPESPFSDVMPASSGASLDEWSNFVDEIGRREVEILLVRGADPIYGLPDGVGFKDAIERLPLIVSFSGRMDDTASMADLILPEHNYLEDWGTDVPNPGPGYQMVGFQQPVVRPFFEHRGIHHGTRNFADVLMVLSQVLGADLDLSADNFLEILRDGARKIYERGRGVAGDKSVGDFTDFQSFWNAVLQNGSWRDEAARFDTTVPIPPEFPSSIQPPSFGGIDTVAQDVFNLIPFASASLSDGSGAHLPWLQATPDPITTATWRTWVEINIRKAEDLGIKEGDVVKVTNGRGNFVEALAYPHPGISPDVVSIPIGQGHSSGGRYSQGRGSNVLSILDTKRTEGTSALAWAATRVKIEKTGRWMRLPRFENTAPELAVDEGGHIIPLTSGD